MRPFIPSPRPLVVGVALSLVGATCPGAFSAAPRTLTFEERVAAEKKIEAVYYAHQIGPRSPFQEVAERKVRTAMEESAALEQIWDAPLTADALAREWERIAGSTNFPDRLRELYQALGNDPFLIQECLVRPELAAHLARGRFEHDPGIHGAARAEAEALRAALVRGTLDPRGDHPRRSGGARDGRVGEIDPVEETAEGFQVRVRTDETTPSTLALYMVPKTSWSDWFSPSSDWV